jgi:hypothetical protein
MIMIAIIADVNKKCSFLKQSCNCFINKILRWYKKEDNQVAN